jgi:hypothetical protein
MPNPFKQLSRLNVEAALKGFWEGFGFAVGAALVGIVVSGVGVMLALIFHLPALWWDRALVALITSSFIGAVALLLAFFTSRNRAPVSQQRKMEYFELGAALGHARKFDDRVLKDLWERCNALDLTFSAAKLGRILDSFYEERDEIEIEGGTIKRTLTIFKEEIRNLEDAVRSELQRT